MLTKIRWIGGDRGMKEWEGALALPHSPPINTSVTGWQYACLLPQIIGIQALPLGLAHNSQLWSQNTTINMSGFKLLES